MQKTIVTVVICNMVFIAISLIKLNQQQAVVQTIESSPRIVQEPEQLVEPETKKPETKKPETSEDPEFPRDAITLPSVATYSFDRSGNIRVAGNLLARYFSCQVLKELEKDKKKYYVIRIRSDEFYVVDASSVIFITETVDSPSIDRLL